VNEPAELAGHINVLGRFCGPRDVPVLDGGSLAARLGARATAVVLFGGSPLAGADVFAEAMRRQVAEHYIVVGGRGHTTAALHATLSAELPAPPAADAPEADLLAAYLEHRHGLRVDLLERESTNCGNNVEYCLRLMAEHDIAPDRLVLIQDATMQRRMDAGFRKHLGPRPRLVNFAAYEAVVTATGGHLGYARPIRGMWDVRHYVTLLLGEVRRLTDDEHGYGPRGRDFIAHVDVPDHVRAAFDAVRRNLDTARVRAADPRWA
jgi:hypothetical protein